MQLCEYFHPDKIQPMTFVDNVDGLQFDSHEV